MNTRKIFGNGARNLFFALAVIFALIFIGCEEPKIETTGGGGGLPDLGGIPSIIIDPSDLTKTTASTGDELTAAYSGTETVSYQWNKGGTAIIGETGQRYTPIEAGTYTVTVSVAGYNPKTSAAVTVTGTTLFRLSGAISITPDSGVVVGDELEAVYTGDETVTFTYQWYKDGVAIPDETNETYTPDDVGSYAVRVSADGYAGKTSAPVTVGWPTPTAEDFAIGNLTQTVSDIKAVTITPRDGKSTGTITIYYNGSTTLPSAVGEYTVTFDVAAAAGWNAASGLYAGTLTIIDAIQYTITGSGTTFTATRGGETVGTANQQIQAVITAIRTDAEGEKVAIQFGDGTDELDIGTASAAFNNTGGEWGDILLLGKITSANTNANQGTIQVGDGVSVNSTADIANTYTERNLTIDIRAIYNQGGTVTISGGTVSATSNWGVAAMNGSSGTLEISGTAHITSKSYTEAAAAATVVNAGAGSLTISGGTVDNTHTGIAVRNTRTGKITISGNAVVTSMNTTTTQGTIFLANLDTTTDVRLEITGGTIHNTNSGNAVYNASTGAVTISGGTISTVSGFAVQSATTNTTAGAGAITLGGSPAITGRIRPAAAGRLSVSGTPTFNPGTHVYTLDYAAYTDGMIVVTGGGSFLSKFALHNQPAYTLGANSGNIVANFIKQNPTAADYNFGNVNQTAGSVTAVTITPKASAPAASAIYYNNSTTIPQTAGTYAVTFDVAATSEWNAASGLSAGTLTVINPTPTADDYIFGNLNQAAGSVMAVTITAKDGASPGAVGNIRYNNSTTIPQTVGTYTVTFDVAAATGWNAATGLRAEPLTVIALPTNYVITGSSGTFTATRSGTNIANGTGPIQDVITAIRANAAGAAASIQFGSGGTNWLDIDTASAQFNNTGGTWGAISLSGNITSTNNTISQGTVLIGGAVSINSTAVITNTSSVANTKAIYHDGTGTVTISGGTVTAAAGNAMNNASSGTITVSEAQVTSQGDTIYNRGTGTVNITGGTVTAGRDPTSVNLPSRAVVNTGTGTVNISGGAVSSPGFYAVTNTNTGTITVSGTAVITADPGGSTTYNYGTISISDSGTDTAPRLIITGGTVRTSTRTNSDPAGGPAITNASTGAVIISGGMVVNTNSAPAVRNTNTGTITVSGTAQVTSADTSTTSGTIFIANSGTSSAARLTISGGTVSNTASGGRAVYNESTGAVNISGGTVSATSFAVQSTNASSAITLGGSPAITGSIRPSAAEKLSVVRTGTNPPPFNPTQPTYTLDYATLASGGIAVVNGGTVSGTSFLSSFTLRVNGTAATLTTNGANLVRE